MDNITVSSILSRLAQSITMFFRSSVGGRAKVMALLLLVMMLCINGMNVINSYVFRYFMSAIEARDIDSFKYYAWLYAAVFVASTLLAVYFRYFEERLGLLWREWLTGLIIGLYIDRRLYLDRDEHATISNPDQRIAEDVRFLTVTTLSFTLMILNSSITIVSFAGVLWAISPLLFLVSVLYAAAGSALTIFLGRPLVKLNYHQADFEADFRSELIRVRVNAEAISKSKEEDQVKMGLRERLNKVIQNLFRIIGVNRRLNFFITGYNYMIQLIPILFVAPIFISSGVEFGIIGQSAMAFSILAGAFSLVVTQFQSISSYASVTTRLSELVEAAESNDKNSNRPSRPAT